MEILADYESSVPVPISVINGRVNALDNDSKFNLFNEQQANSNNNCTFQNDAVSHQFLRTDLSDLFFSPQNIDALQHGMMVLVLERTDGQFKIGRQSDIELKIIMRSIFLQNAEHRRDIPIVNQVRVLNKMVLDFSVPRIIADIKQRQYYLNDISKLPVPLERAHMMGTKGSKTLEWKG